MMVKLPNLSVLLQFQKRLDDHIVKEKKIVFNTSDLKVLAFKVEFGEFLNEHQFFKFWKENRLPKEGLLEEFVDGVHFLLSLANERKWSKFIHAADAAEWEDRTLVTLALDIYNNPLASAGDWLECVCDYFQMAHLMGFTIDEIEKAYLKKNKVNLDRQNNGY